LTEIYNNDREIVDFKQRLLGYGISGLNKEHVLPVLWGAGRNGKDTLLDAISHVLGDLALPVSSEVVLSGYRPPNSATPHLYALRPLRLAWVSESEEGARLNTGQIKFLTGGGLVTARPLYGKPITFKPQYLLFLVTNHRPHASGSDYGLWKRLLLIPFKQAFVDDPDPQRENEHLRDKDLGEKLKAEAPGILAWLVRGFLAWQGQGLNPPEAITRATTAYKTEEDVIAQFLEEKCVILPGAKIKASAFYLAYKTWAREYGWRLMKGAAFGRRVNELFERRRRSDGFWYLGIGLTSSDEDQSIAQMEF
jgi:putative DNA primase/helicase